MPRNNLPTALPQAVLAEPTHFKGSMRKQDIITLEALQDRFDKPLLAVVRPRCVFCVLKVAPRLCKAKEFGVCLTYIKKIVTPPAPMNTSPWRPSLSPHAAPKVNH